MEKCKIFFDFGGTLADTIEITRSIFKEVLKKDLSREEMKQFYKDISRRRTPMDLFFKYPVNPIKLLFTKRKIKKMQEEQFLERIELFPNVKEEMERIKKIANVELILLTQNPQFQDSEYANKLLNKLFGFNPFSFVLSGNDKYELIVRTYGEDDLSGSLLIGDLPNDIYTADMLKIPAIGVTWGYSTARELVTPFLAHDIEDLYDLILEHVKEVEEESTPSHEEKKLEELVKDIKVEMDEEF